MGRSSLKHPSTAFIMILLFCHAFNFRVYVLIGLFCYLKRQAILLFVYFETLASFIAGEFKVVVLFCVRTYTTILWK